MKCPLCGRRYEDPVKFHHHLLDELRRVDQEFRELVRAASLKFDELRLVSKLTGTKLWEVRSD